GIAGDLIAKLLLERLAMLFCLDGVRAQEQPREIEHVLMRRGVRALRITELALIAIIDRVVVIRFRKLVNRSTMGMSSRHELVIFGIDAVEEIDKRRAQPIAQPAAVAY